MGFCVSVKEDAAETQRTTSFLRLKLAAASRSPKADAERPHPPAFTQLKQNFGP